MLTMGIWYDPVSRRLHHRKIEQEWDWEREGREGRLRFPGNPCRSCSTTVEASTPALHRRAGVVVHVRTREAIGTYKLLLQVW